MGGRDWTGRRARDIILVRRPTVARPRRTDLTDDRVLKATRVVSVAIVPVLAAAFVLLYVFPTRTRQLWAWEMHPTMTAMVMGGGYLSGAYFFCRVATVDQWHRVGLGFVAITAFATMLAIATLLHWDRFNHGHVSFWAWSLLYFSTPVLLPWLWARNRRHDPRRLEPGDRIVPTPVRVAVVAVGAVQLTVAAVMFFRPSAIASHAPWMLTPLTCRSLSAFAAFPSVVYLAFAFERRWSSFQILVEVAIAGMVLIGVAAIRARAEFDGSDVVVWGWRIGLAVALVLFTALRIAMARPAPARRARRVPA
ncbi:MAG TPA: hypothetical protein VG455_15125 [Acidimicrobiales bacterium]|nr:hypothetical protein [Acidimicrobiales bacterium]